MENKKFKDLGEESITVLVPYLECSKCPASYRVAEEEMHSAPKYAKNKGWNVNPPLCPTCLKVN